MSAAAASRAMVSLLLTRNPNSGINEFSTIGNLFSSHQGMGPLAPEFREGLIQAFRRCHQDPVSISQPYLRLCSLSWVPGRSTQLQALHLHF